MELRPRNTTCLKCQPKISENSAKWAILKWSKIGYSQWMAHLKYQVLRKTLFAATIWTCACKPSNNISGCVKWTICSTRATSKSFISTVTWLIPQKRKCPIQGHHHMSRSPNSAWMIQDLNIAQVLEASWLNSRPTISLATSIDNKWQAWANLMITISFSQFLLSIRSTSTLETDKTMESPDLSVEVIHPMKLNQILAVSWTPSWCTPSKTARESKIAQPWTSTVKMLSIVTHLEASRPRWFLLDHRSDQTIWMPLIERWCHIISRWYVHLSPIIRIITTQDTKAKSLSGCQSCADHRHHKGLSSTRRTLMRSIRKWLFQKISVIKNMLIRTHIRVEVDQPPSTWVLLLHPLVPSLA